MLGGVGGLNIRVRGLGPFQAGASFDMLLFRFDVCIGEEDKILLLTGANPLQSPNPASFTALENFSFARLPTCPLKSN